MMDTESFHLMVTLGSPPPPCTKQNRAERTGNGCSTSLAHLVHLGFVKARAFAHMK